MGKERILRILEIFRKTDESHALTISEIIDKLRLYGIEAERKAISRDIQTLSDGGYTIISAGKREGYYLSEGLFEDYELMMLFSAITRAKFITAKDSRAVLKKLSSITPFGMEKLLKEMELGDSLKTTNVGAKYAIDGIIRAIKDDRKLRFQYFEYAGDGKKILRRDGHVYNVSPFYLAWVRDELFMIANPTSHQWLTHFNVAKMTKVEVSDEPRKARSEIEELTEKFNLGEYIKESMNMYTGEAIDVTIRCHKDLLFDVEMAFGSDIWPRKSDGDWVSVTVRAKDNQGLYRWLLQYGDKIEVVSPSHIRAEVKAALVAAIDIYNEETHV